MFTQEEILTIEHLLTQNANVLIVTHYNPDGDAIGSSLALQLFLETLSINATVLVPNDFPKFLKWMPNAKKTVIAEYKRKIAYKLIEEAEVIFVLDLNAFHRCGNFLEPLLQKSNAKKIVIDHHQQPDIFDFVYSDTNIPATCQMLYHFIEALDKKQLVNKDIATCLYTGIMTDTGGFRFRSTSAKTHQVIAELIEKGADPALITSNTWDTNSINRLTLLALVLSRIQVVKGGSVAVLYLKRDEMKNIGFEKGDTEGFVNYGLSLLGVQVAALFIEDLHEDFIKISFRSKNEVDMNAFSRKYFSGGGHINAAGGKCFKSIEDTIRYFIECIENEQF